MYYSLNSLKGAYTEDYVGEYRRVTKRIQGVWTVAHAVVSI